MSVVVARFLNTGKEAQIELDLLREPRAPAYCPRRSIEGEYESNLYKGWYERHLEGIASESESEERGE